jgi:hypothetical protein
MGSNPIQYFDDYSWKIFIALNWPAKDDERAVVKPGATFGDVSGQLIFGTYKAAWELFQPGGRRPSEWKSFEAASPCPNVRGANAGKVRVFQSFAKFGPVLDDFNQAGFGPNPLGSLVAQNRTYVNFEIRLNETEYSKIRGDDTSPKTHLYLSTNLPPTGNQVTFPNGAIEIKAAWRRIKLPDEQNILNRYYHVEAEVFNPKDKTCEKQTFGLVGFHIVQKTPSRPQWIWSTFEHVDNVQGASRSFNNPNGSQDINDANVNKLLPPVNAINGPQANPPPVQVVRVGSLPESTKKTNDLYQKDPRIAGTVWANYQLIKTQWPTTPLPVDLSKPFPAGAGNPFPASQVANVTMETTTFLQSGNSCMQCHFLTKETDFVWFLPIRAFRGTPANAAVRLNALTPALKKLHEASKTNPWKK